MTEIIHTPYGQEHPYEQLPEERFPRHPHAGQPFTAGIAMRPPGAVDRVIVRFQVDGGEVQTAEADRIENWQPQLEDGVGAEFLERIIKVEQDIWQAHLTAPPAGQTLTYWAEAGDLRTEAYQVTGMAWREGGGVTVQADGTMLVAANASSVPSHSPELKRVEWLHDGRRAHRVRLSFSCAPDERFYGLGERFNALNQRGNVLDVRCYEQYKNQGKRTYMPIPFLLSSAGYGLWVQSSRWMQFDLAAADNNLWTLEADLGADETLRLRWFRDSDPFAIVGQFATLTGPVKLPPQWAFGLWMSGNEWNTQAKIMQEVETSLAHGIQPAVLVIEAWSDETTFYVWNDAQYTPVPGDQRLRYADFTFPPEGKWPDPKGMVDWLHTHDIKLLLWQVPVLKDAGVSHPQHDADRAYYEQAGFGAREPDGSPYRVRPFWFRGGYLWDVTNAAEREWWLNKRAYLLEDLGIDGFKTDGGEHLWGEAITFADGRSGAEVWNEYPQLYTEAYHAFANRYRAAITFSRAGYTGSQRAPLHWAGDENSTWDAYRHSILAGLSAGVSGIPFWGWDFGGFSGEVPDAELYLRAAAMAALCPVFQYHSEYNAHRQPSHDRTPWNIQQRSGDERVIPIFRSLMALRHQLMPYIWQEAQYAAQTGQPMMRALHLLTPNASPYDYLFGRDLLVAPVVQPGVTSWQVYLPEGQWRWLWSADMFEGGREVTVDTPLDRIPAFVREGADIPAPHGNDISSPG